MKIFKKILSFHKKKLVIEPVDAQKQQSGKIYAACPTAIADCIPPAHGVCPGYGVV